MAQDTSKGAGAAQPLAAWKAALRDWQARAVTNVLSHPAADFLAMATPAAGKTRFALRVAHEYVRTGRAQRLLIVCPTNHLRTQWANAAGAVGLHLDPALTNEQTREAPDYHGAVVTYQQVALAPQVFQRACAERTTLVVLDELHHAADGRHWGRALRQAFDGAVFRLVLSGTPFRSDNHPIPFVRYEQSESRADFAYGYTDALKDGVCRPILFPSYEGELSWLSEGREHHATFEDGLTFERQRERLKTALLQESWLGPVIADAHKQLTLLRKQEQPDAAGLIVSMDQDHARWIAALVEKWTGTKAAVAVSDDPAASKTIEAFAEQRRQQWLVAVNMVSEGVDIPRLRVGVYGTNVLTEMYFRQVVGRFVRMSHKCQRHNGRGSICLRTRHWYGTPNRSKQSAIMSSKTSCPRANGISSDVRWCRSKSTLHCMPSPASIRSSGRTRRGRTRSPPWPSRPRYTTSSGTGGSFIACW